MKLDKIIRVPRKMSEQPLLFTADRRSIQGTMFHFSERPSGQITDRGASQQENLTWTLDKIYRDKFTWINQQLRSVLVSILVADVPLNHRNLTLLATANWIVFDMRNRYNVNEITPELFAPYFNYVASQLMSGVTGKTPEESQEIRAKFKVALLRYIFYIQQHTTWPVVAAPTPATQ